MRGISCSLEHPTDRSIEVAQHPARWLRSGGTQVEAAAVYHGCVFATYTRVATAVFGRTQFRGYIRGFGDGEREGVRQEDRRIT